MVGRKRQPDLILFALPARGLSTDYALRIRCPKGLNTDYRPRIKGGPGGGFAGPRGWITSPVRVGVRHAAQQNGLVLRKGAVRALNLNLPNG
eukprot:6651831-Pyramimonas_sp.AAC.1